MIKLASQILNNAVNGFVAGNEAKQKIKAARAEAESKVYVKAAESVTEWERIMAKNSGDSWKDEYLTVFFSLLFAFLIVLFLYSDKEAGELSQYVNGLLNDTTLGHILLIIVSCSFGIRSIPKFGGVIERLVKK